MDSLLHFGINTKEEDRSSYRMVTDCAPITTQGFQSGWLSASDPNDTSSTISVGPSVRYLLFYYGPSTLFSVSFDSEKS